MTRSQNDKGTTGWREELRCVLDTHNGMPSALGKTANHKSQRARADGLKRIFTLLHAAGLKVSPCSLGGRHVEFLVQYWTRDPRALEGLRARHSRLAMPPAPLSGAYIQQQLSFLRTFSAWIGKPGLVRPARCYVSDPGLLACASHATGEAKNHLYQGGRQSMLDKVMSADPHVELQLEVMLAFGVSCREAIEFCPGLAAVPQHVLMSAGIMGDWLAFVRYRRGTPCMHVRLTPICSDEQRAVVERARAVAPNPGTNLCRPHLGSKQAEVRFRNVLRRCGVSLQRLGVTARERERAFSEDIHFELRSIPAPRGKGAPGADGAVMDAVHAGVARQLERRQRRPQQPHEATATAQLKPEK